MTVKSPREIERALEQFDDDDDSGGAVVGLETPGGEVVGPDDEPIENASAVLRIPPTVHETWRDEYRPDLEGSDA